MYMDSSLLPVGIWGSSGAVIVGPSCGMTTFRGKLAVLMGCVAVAHCQWHPKKTRRGGRQVCMLPSVFTAIAWPPQE